MPAPWKKRELERLYHEQIERQRAEERRRLQPPPAALEARRQELDLHRELDDDEYDEPDEEPDEPEPLGPRLIPRDAATPARRTDPETSHEAADSVLNLTAKRRAVLEVLDGIEALSGLADREIAGFYRDDPDRPQQSPSGLRTRRCELVDAGLVADSGLRVEYGGRRHIVWKITRAGRDALA